MGIKTLPHPPYNPDLAAPCDFWLFPKLRGCRYETIEEIKEAVMKVIDMLTQEDFHGAFQKLLKWYNKCIAAREDYFEGDKSFMCVLSIKVSIQKQSGNLSAPCISSSCRASSTDLPDSPSPLIYCPLLPAGLLGNILCLHRAAVDKF